jgi:hypothetical protein
MPHPAQVDELAAKHQALERMIQEEMQRPGSSDLKIAEMKRRKLLLKDEIAELRAKTRH